MTKKQKHALVIGAGALAAGGLAYYLYAKSKALPVASGVTPGTVNTVTLQPGAMPSVNLSLSNHDALSIVAPTGATLGNVTVFPSGILGAPASGANYEYVAIAAGAATITATYTDPSGATQTATIQALVA